MEKESGQNHPTYQRAVTPTMDSSNPAAGNSLVRGKLMSYQASQMRRFGTGKSSGSYGQDSQDSSAAAGSSTMGSSYKQSPMQQQQPDASGSDPQIQIQQQQNLFLLQQQQRQQNQNTQQQQQQQPPPPMNQFPPRNSIEMNIQGRAPVGRNGLGSAGVVNSNNSLNSAGGINNSIRGNNNHTIPLNNAQGSNVRGNDGTDNTTTVSSKSPLPRYDLVPVVDEVPHDGIIFARIRNAPDSLVVFRTPEERLRNPERLNLDRRQLDTCPILEQELRLRLLNFQNNNIRTIKNLENLPNLIFLDLYNNKLSSLEGSISLVKGLRVLMAGKNRISAISNLTSLRKLDVLDLHSNDIKEIEGLDALADLRVLNLAGNKISSVQNLSFLQSLTELNLRRNNIDRVLELDKLPTLQRVFLSHNLIANMQNMICLFNVKFLIELSLDGNPLSEEDPLLYRRKIIAGMRGLRHLDLKRITEEEIEFADQHEKVITQDFGLSKDDGEGKIDSRFMTSENGESDYNNELNGSLNGHGFNAGKDLSNHGIAALARAGRVPSSHSLFDLELVAPNEKALVAVGDSWEWVQTKRLFVNVTEASLYHMKRNIITTKFAANISWLPALKCLRLVNNNLESLKDIGIVLESFGTSLYLEHLSIRDNPICALQSLMRAYVIVMIPSLVSFNDLNISDTERADASRTLQPVLKIQNLAIAQQTLLSSALVPENQQTNQLIKGNFGGQLRSSKSSNVGKRPQNTMGSSSIRNVGNLMSISPNEEQAVAELCSEISGTALNRRKFCQEFDEQLKQCIKQVFVDTVGQLHCDS